MILGDVGGVEPGVCAGTGMLRVTPCPDLSRSVVKSFTNIENKVGDKMSPCFTPWGQLKYSVLWVLSGDVRITLVIGFLYSDNREKYILPTIPNWVEILWNNSK